MSRCLVGHLCTRALPPCRLAPIRHKGTHCSGLTAALLPATLISNPQDDDVRHYVKIYGKKVEKVRTGLLSCLTRRRLLFRLGLPGLFKLGLRLGAFCGVILAAWTAASPKQPWASLEQAALPASSAAGRWHGPPALAVMAVAVAWQCAVASGSQANPARPLQLWQPGSTRCSHPAGAAQRTTAHVPHCIAAVVLHVCPTVSSPRLPVPVHRTARPPSSAPRSSAW